MADSARTSPEFTADEIANCIRLLERLASERILLDTIPPAERRALLIAAGQVSRPSRYELKKMAKIIRRNRRADRRAEDALVCAGTEIRTSQRSSVYVPPTLRLEAGEEQIGPELHGPRNCYICKEPFRRVHFFYHSMCAACAQLNYQKRSQSASLTGRVALITGARLKIGYQAALMLLRAGARVVATTRFPHDAAERYAKEPDFAKWSDRLELHGIDLRHVPSVELFASYVEQSRDRLDILINNAAQTVRRPTGFYAHLVEREEQAVSTLSPAAQPLLAAHVELRAELRGGQNRNDHPAGAGLVAWHGGSNALGLLSPARLSQLPCTPDDLQVDPFPAGELDPDLQQVDRRTMNSWRLRLGEVSTPELLEVHLVNAVAPFILNNHLKALMMRQRTDEKHIVNVSAMEAQFSRNKKTDKHPHTNMAKAALNMMTRTSAVDYAQHGIFMNSVDTGWVTDEDPLIHVDRKQRDHDFHPPLDAVDGAARICDPIFTGLNTRQHMWGLFLKDYRPVAW